MILYLNLKSLFSSDNLNQFVYPFDYIYKRKPKCFFLKPLNTCQKYFIALNLMSTSEFIFFKAVKYSRIVNHVQEFLFQFHVD